MSQEQIIANDSIDSGGSIASETSSSVSSSHRYFSPEDLARNLRKAIALEIRPHLRDLATQQKREYVFGKLFPRFSELNYTKIDELLAQRIDWYVDLTALHHKSVVQINAFIETLAQRLVRLMNWQFTVGTITNQNVWRSYLHPKGHRGLILQPYINSTINHLGIWQTAREYDVDRDLGDGRLVLETAASNLFVSCIKRKKGMLPQGQYEGFLEAELAKMAFTIPQIIERIAKAQTSFGDSECPAIQTVITRNGYRVYSTSYPPLYAEESVVRKNFFDACNFIFGLNPSAIADMQANKQANKQAKRDRAASAAAAAEAARKEQDRQTSAILHFFSKQVMKVFRAEFNLSSESAYTDAEGFLQNWVFSYTDFNKAAKLLLSVASLRLLIRDLKSSLNNFYVQHWFLQQIDASGLLNAEGKKALNIPKPNSACLSPIGFAKMLKEHEENNQVKSIFERLSENLIGRLVAQDPDDLGVDIMAKMMTLIKSFKDYASFLSDNPTFVDVFAEELNKTESFEGNLAIIQGFSGALFRTCHRLTFELSYHQLAYYDTELKTVASLATNEIHKNIQETLIVGLSAGLSKSVRQAVVSGNINRQQIEENIFTNSVYQHIDIQRYIETLAYAAMQKRSFDFIEMFFEALRPIEGRYYIDEAAITEAFNHVAQGLGVYTEPASLNSFNNIPSSSSSSSSTTSSAPTFFSSSPSRNSQEDSVTKVIELSQRLEDSVTEVVIGPSQRPEDEEEDPALQSQPTNQFAMKNS